MNFTSKQKGDIGEAAVLFDLLKKGYRLVRVDGESFDYILYTGKKNLFIQVKYRRITKKGSRTIIETSARRNNASNKLRCTNRGFDVLATYCPDTEKIYYLHLSELTEKSAANLGLEKPVNNQCKKIRYASEYENFDLHKYLLLNEQENRSSN